MGSLSTGTGNTTASWALVSPALAPLSNHSQDLTKIATVLTCFRAPGVHWKLLCPFKAVPCELVLLYGEVGNWLAEEKLAATRGQHLFLHPILTEGGAWALRMAELGTTGASHGAEDWGSLGNKDLLLPPVPRPKCLWVLTAKGKQPPNMHPGLKPFPKHIIKASCDPHICCLLKRFLTY